MASGICNPEDTPVDEDAWLAVVDANRGRLVQAARAFEQWSQMYQLARDSSDARMQIYAIANIQSAFVSEGSYAVAIDCGRFMVQLARACGDQLSEGHALIGLGWSFWGLGDHSEASRIAQLGLDLADAIADVPFPHFFEGPETIRVGAQELLNTIRVRRGQLRRALADQRQVLEIHRKRSDDLRIASSHEAIGLTSKDLGRFAEALASFHDALEVLENHSDGNERHVLQAKAGLLGNVAVVHTHLRQFEQAHSFIAQSSAIHVQLTDLFGLMGCLGQRGVALLKQGEHQEAIRVFGDVLTAAKELPSISLQHVAHINLAEAHTLCANFSDAAVHCEQAIEISGEQLGGITTEHLWQRCRLFWNQIKAESPKRASDDAVFVLLSCYAIEQLKGEVRQSKPIAVVDKWIPEFESVIETTLSESDAAHFSMTGKDTPQDAWCRRYYELARRSGFVGWSPIEIGFHIVESLRAQEFLEKLHLDAIEVEEELDPSLTACRASIEAEIAKLRQMPMVITGTVSFDDAGNRVVKDASKESIEKQLEAADAHRRKLDDAIARRAAVEEAIETANPAIAATSNHQPATIQDVQSVLRDKELFLEYVVNGQAGTRHLIDGEVILASPARPEGEAFVVAVTRDDVHVISLGKSEQIVFKVRALLKLLAIGTESPRHLRFPNQKPTTSPAAFQDIARQVAALLLDPPLERLGPHRTNANHLVIASDGILNLLPFDLLPTEDVRPDDWNDLAYVAKSWSTEVVPSATVFTDLRNGRYRRGDPGSAFVGFADPVYRRRWSGDDINGRTITFPDRVNRSDTLASLPGSRREVEAISALFVAESTGKAGTDYSSQLFLGPEATKESLTQGNVLLDARYLHIACHGTADQGRAAEGALFLADSDTSDDGVLMSHEIMRLRTNANLVVLSACETGLGKLSRGEGVQGMVRAWLFAGAQAVLASLWRVGDGATCMLMTEFYRHVVQGTSLPTALALARRRLINDQEFSDPCHWAPFVLLGAGQNCHDGPRAT